MYDMWLAYGQSKTALMLFAVGLAQRLGPKGLTAFSIHPGAIWTNLTRDVTDQDWGGPGASKYLRCIYVDRHLDTAFQCRGAAQNEELQPRDCHIFRRRV